LSDLYNYFDDLKLFSDLYLAKFLDTSMQNRFFISRSIIVNLMEGELSIRRLIQNLLILYLFVVKRCMINHKQFDKTTLVKAMLVNVR